MDKLKEILKFIGEFIWYIVLIEAGVAMLMVFLIYMDTANQIDMPFENLKSTWITLSIVIPIVIVIWAWFDGGRK